MIINSPEPQTRKVDDLEFIFIDGVSKPVTVDKEAGDSVDWDSHLNAIVINIKAKTSPDGFTQIPEEDITIFRTHLLYIEHRSRDITELTTAQKEEWKKTFQELATKTIQ